MPIVDWIGRPIDAVMRGRAIVERTDSAIAFSDGTIAYLDHGRVARARLHPCSLRPPYERLVLEGFVVAPDAHVESLRDTSALVGVVGFRVEGRAGTCTISHE